MLLMLQNNMSMAYLTIECLIFYKFSVTSFDTNTPELRIPES